MLVRTSSTPALGSIVFPPASAADVELQSTVQMPPTPQSQFSGLSSPASLCWNVSSEVQSLDGGDWDFDKEVVPWPRFRRAQSENDLQSMEKQFSSARCTANAFLGSEGWDDTDITVNTPRKQWSRRTNIQRHSSLPIPLQKSAFEEFLAPIPDSLGEDLEDDKSDVLGSFEQNCQIKEAEQSIEDMEEKGGQEAGTCISAMGGKECSVLLDGEEYSSISIGANGQPLVCNSRGCRPFHDSEKLSGAMSLAGGFGIGMGGGISNYGKRVDEHGDGYHFNMDYYYRRMIESDPGHPLLLRNYAKFLYEVKKDYKKAEEYYERAILSSPSEPEVLAEYAKLVWDLYKDEDRAASYFDRALQVAPDNCYVLGAYSAFAWEREGQNEEENSYCSYERLPTVVTA